MTDDSKRPVPKPGMTAGGALGADASEPLDFADPSDISSAPKPNPLLAPPAAHGLPLADSPIQPKEPAGRWVPAQSPVLPSSRAASTPVVPPGTASGPIAPVVGQAVRDAPPLSARAPGSYPAPTSGPGPGTAGGVPFTLPELATARPATPPAQPNPLATTYPSAPVAPIPVPVPAPPVAQPVPVPQPRPAPTAPSVVPPTADPDPTPVPVSVAPPDRGTDPAVPPPGQPDEPIDPTRVVAVAPPDEPVDPTRVVAVAPPDEPVDPTRVVAVAPSDEPTDPTRVVAAATPDEPTDPRIPTQEEGGEEPTDPRVSAAAGERDDPTDPSIAKPAKPPEEDTDPSQRVAVSGQPLVDPDAIADITSPSVTGATTEWSPLATDDKTPVPADGRIGLGDAVVVDTQRQERLNELRLKQDQLLRARIAEVAVVMLIDLITDYDEEGDLIGRQKGLAHNALLFPIINGHHGVVVKTVGEAIIACFVDGESSLRAAAELQQAVAKHNRACKDASDELSIRVGIHAGPATAEGGELQGPAVSIATGVQATAQPGEIMATEAVVTRVRDFEVEPVGPVTPKGQPGPVSVFRVRWAFAGETEAASDSRLMGGRYRLTSLIGRGPIGEVWAAQDQRLRGSVVVKVMRRFVVEGEGAEERFQDWVETLATLQHDGVARMLDCAPRGAPEAFYVADRIDGPDLALWVARNGCPAPRRAARLVRRIAEAVLYGHRRGVRHGNIKPENVLIGPDNQPVLVDFGGATFAAAARPGVPLGSVAFQAPEQVASGRVDVRTDIYGLGALLYFVLTGRTPYNTSATLHAMRAVVSGMFKRLARLRPELPAGLHDLCDKAMAIEPRSRFPTIEAFSAALDIFCRAESPKLDDLRDRNGLPEHGDGDEDEDENENENEPALPDTFIGLTPQRPLASVNLEDIVQEPTVIGLYPRRPTGDGADGSPTGRLKRPVPKRTLAAQIQTLRWALIGVSAIALAALFAFFVSLCGGSEPPAAAKNGAATAPTQSSPGARAPAADGALVLTTKPRNKVQVSINSQLIGTTPEVMTIWLTPGTHRLRLEHPKFKPYEEVIKIGPGQRLNRQVDLRSQR